MIYVLDTSALKWAYIPGRNHLRCRQLVSRNHSETHIAEVSVLEFRSALGSEYRKGTINKKQVEIADKQFFEDLSTGRLQVRRFPPSEYVPCLQLLFHVGVDLGKSLGTSDAIVAHTARQLAIERRTHIKLLTSDERLAKTLKKVPLFSSLIKAEYLDPR